jgi:LiaI-LiaF-like transmembrane region
MAQDGSPRHGSLVFPILMITFGALFLYANWRPSFDPWPVLTTYWPLILIFLGLGKIWDVWRGRGNPDTPP